MKEEFYEGIKDILNDARNKVYQTANFAMVEAYWLIGKRIVEEQGGQETAQYGKGLIKELSKKMTRDFGKGFTVTNLKYMRQFYLTFPNGHALRGELSWTHYRLLIKVENERARQYYLNEAVNCQWSTRQLERQINSFSYERLLVSKNKNVSLKEEHETNLQQHPEDIIRDPYVLEFLGLNQDEHFVESELEQALITHLQKFLRELLNEGDNPPIGIILCADKSDAVVKYTLPEGESQIFASKYKLHLPSEEELLKEIKREYLALEYMAMDEDKV